MTFDTGNEPQYKKKCAECKVRLCINTPIMCYTAPNGKDKTFCNDCYWDEREPKYYLTDTNPDNEDDFNNYAEGLENDWVEKYLEKNLPPVQEYIDAGKYGNIDEFLGEEQSCMEVAMAEASKASEVPFPSFHEFDTHFDIGVLFDNIENYYEKAVAGLIQHKPKKKKLKIVDKPKKKKLKIVPSTHEKIKKKVMDFHEECKAKGAKDTLDLIKNGADPLDATREIYGDNMANKVEALLNRLKVPDIF